MKKRFNLKDGDEITCTLGSREAVLRVPAAHAGCICGKNAATVSDCRPENLGTFGLCGRTNPPGACVPVVLNQWLMGDKSVKINGEEALLDGSILSCACGGIIKVKQ